MADTPRRFKLDKARSSAKIDAIVSLAMACVVAVEQSAWATVEPRLITLDA